MTIARLPITTGVDVEFSGGGIIQDGSLAKNILYNKYVDGKIYATQRPAINIRGIASLLDIPPKGRGMTYWDDANSFVIVNDDTIYMGGYGFPIPGKISKGKDPVELIEFHNGYLVILDRENNEGWYLTASLPTFLNKITDTDFPCNIPGIQLAGGGAFLDGYLFVMDTEGKIYNCDLDDPTSWDALNFVQVEQEIDEGIFLTKHHSHIVAIGAKSIEFFYDNANPVGSPIQPRQDISYITGALDFKSVYNTGNSIYFVGSERTGTLGLFQIEQFTLTKVSNDSIDTYLSNTVDRSKFDLGVTGAAVGDHHLIFINALAPTFNESTSSSKSVTLSGQSTTSSRGIITRANHPDVFLTGQQINSGRGSIHVGGSVTSSPSVSLTGIASTASAGSVNYGSPAIVNYWSPQYTLVFDSYSKSFVQFETNVSTIDAFSVMGSTERNSTAEKEATLMFFNGDYGSFDLTFKKLDGASSDPLYMDEDYLIDQDDYIQDLGEDTTASIEAIILLAETDFGSVTNKFMNRISLIGTTTAPSEDTTPIKVSWTDDHYRTYSNERDLATGLNRSLTRCGTFRRRAHKLRYTGTDVIRIEGVEADLRASRYA